MSKPRPQTVADVMTTEVITLGENDNLHHVEEGMQRFRFRHLPVVSEGKLVGLITLRDMLHASSSSLSADRADRDVLIHERALAHMVMQKNVLSVRPDLPLVEAAQTMWDEKLGCLPVTQEDSTLLGIVTEADFLKLSIELLSASTDLDDV